MLMSKITAKHVTYIKTFHDILSCYVRNMKSNIARTAFLKRKMQVVKRPEFEDRLQEHLYQKVFCTQTILVQKTCVINFMNPTNLRARVTMLGVRILIVFLISNTVTCVTAGQHIV